MTAQEGWIGPTQAETIKADESARIPLGRRGMPEDVAQWIVSLASPTAAWISGKIFAVDGGYANFNAPLVGLWMRTIGSWMLRVNSLARPLSDMLSHNAAQTIEHNNEQYRRLVDGVFHAPETDPGAGRLTKAFRLVTQAHSAAERVILAQRTKQLAPRLLPAQVADDAVKAGVVNALEAQLLKHALTARLEAIEVDVFTPDQFYAGLNKGSSIEPSEARQDTR